MKSLNNPFVIYGYKGPAYFCDRTSETHKLIEALHNERNITLISPRRMGKTGLIHHVFNQIKEEHSEVKCFYIDILSTKNLAQFVQLFAKNILGNLDSTTKTAVKKLSNFFKAWRPAMTFDEISGAPTVTLDFNPNESRQTLKQIFEYLGQSGKRCYIAIDEFQQILNYSDEGVEALLRSYIQFLPNVYFIFSGSIQHLMIEMFQSANHPFYQAAQMVSLGPIDKDEYREFASKWFEKKKRNLLPETFDAAYDQFDGTTWYIQDIMNRVYNWNGKVITTEILKKAINEIIEEQTTTFLTYCSWLTENQFNLLKAIAKEGVVKEITSIEFVQKHQLTAPSSIKAAAKSLMERQLVFRNLSNCYSVYDKFFGIWLSRQ